MIQNNIHKNLSARHYRHQGGFTIVELLIVVVVIAVLAAITIISYNGITQRSNTASAQEAGQSLAKKAELYYQDPTTPTNYPGTFALLTATSGQLYSVGASSFTFRDTTKTISPTGYIPTSANEFNYFACGTNGTTSAPGSYSGITNYTGTRIVTWNFTTKAVINTDTGVVSGNVGTSPVACFQSNT